MNSSEPVTLTRDVEAAVVPIGTKVTLQQGEQAYITQSLGGSYTVVVNGNMFRVEGKDADALGLEVASAKAAGAAAAPVSAEDLEKKMWDALRSCYDPEIPVNIADLGLIYDCKLSPMKDDQTSYRVDIKMTLTALGCPMAADVMADVRDHLLTLPGITDAGVDIVYEPMWTPERMSEEARWELGMV